MGVIIGKKIKTLRKAHNLTQKKFGEIIHYSRTAISNFEHNKRQPSFELLCSIADYFQINIMYFYNDDCTEIGNEILTVLNNKSPLDITNLTPSLQAKLVKIYFEFKEQSKYKEKSIEEQITE